MTSCISHCIDQSRSHFGFENYTALTMEGKLRVNCHSILYPLSVVLDVGWINFISHVLNISNKLSHHMQDTPNVRLVYIYITATRFNLIYYFDMLSV